ncbi:MAG: hypothetical protein V4819_19870 [Verrucomicrobiota bacterium]
MPFRFFCLLLALLSPVLAQDKISTKAAGGLQVKFLAEQAPESLGNVFLQFGDKEKSADFTLPTNRLSDPVAVEVRVMVLKTLDKAIPLCTITLPEVGSEFAVVLVTTKPAGFKPIVVRTDDPSFKAGDVLFINLTEKTVLGKLGTTPLVLKPGETAKSRPSGAIDNTYYDIAFATREETGDKLLSSSRWPIDNMLRSYLFFFTNAQGRTTFRAVDEYLTPPAPAKP